MSKMVDITRWKQGQEIWNEWAASDGSGDVDFSGLNDPGDYFFDGLIFPANANFGSIRCKSKVSFRGCKFNGSVNFTNALAAEFDFSETEFSAEANFHKTQFRGVATFQDVAFNSDANFKDVTFENRAEFSNTKFSTVTFDQARFLKGANFTKCDFSSDASFRSANLNKAIFDSASFNGETTFENCHFQSILSLAKTVLSGDGSITFRGGSIDCDADFSESNFVGPFNAPDFKLKQKVTFRKCTFSSKADFSRAAFQKVTFAHCKFRKKSDPKFESVRFSNMTSFKSFICEANISFKNGVIEEQGIIDFEDAKFGRQADFSFFSFLRPASFINARFNGKALFRNIKSEYEFDLASAQFRVVPDFLFTTFAEPPSFEGVLVANPLKRRWSNLKNDPRRWFLKFMRIADDGSISQKYRKLKSLAIAGHDHRGELDFFAAEIQSKRFWHDGLGSLSFYAGILYEAFSSFGRSALKPFGLWLFSTIFFAFLYLNSASATHCRGSAIPVCDVAFVSIVHALPFLFWGRSETVQNVSQCLFGQPNLPPTVVVIAILQNIMSTVLIFLFFLALRNQFKIR